MKSILLSSGTQSEEFKQVESVELAGDCIPLLIYYDLIIVDLGEDKKLGQDLIEEIRLATELGAATLVLVSRQSDLAVVQKLAGIAGSKIRVPGSDFQLDRNSPGQYLEPLVAGFSTFFRAGSNWYSLAYLKAVDVMVAGFSPLKNGFIGLFPRPEKLDDNYISNLSGLTVWWKKKRSPLRQLKVFLMLWCLFFIAASSVTTYLRYSQREENIQVKNLDWLQNYEVRVRRWDLDSASVSAIYRQYPPFPVPFSQAQFLSAFDANKLSALNIARELGRQGLVNDLVKSYAERSPRGAIAWLEDDMFGLMRRGYLRRAALRARQILELTRDVQFENDQFLQKVQHTHELISRNFLRTEQDVDWGEVVDNRYQARRQLKAETSDPSLRDNIAYYQIAAGYRKPNENDAAYFSERRGLWAEFIEQFPGSEKSDEAAFNMVLLDTYLIGIHKDNALLTEIFFGWLVKDTGRMVSEFPESYLTDDALYYLSLFSAELNRIDICIATLGKLFNVYAESDHAIRLANTSGYAAIVVNGENPQNILCNNVDFREGHWEFRL